jgi:hypothetical protein
MKKKERRKIKRLFFSNRDTTGNDYKALDAIIESGHLLAQAGKVLHVYIAHDDNCPAFLTDGEKPCTCKPVIRI